MNRDFEKLLANHCAPLLFGKKPAVLLAESVLPPDCEWQLLRPFGVHVLRLRWCDKNTLILLYHPALLADALSHVAATGTLLEMGYSSDSGVTELLAHLCRRFAESNEFPHEVGFFLGYPPEDVIGFLDCKDSCKLCGQWKVYGDVDRALSLFNEYERYKRKLLNHIHNGRSIFTAISPALAG